MNQEELHPVTGISQERNNQKSFTSKRWLQQKKKIYQAHFRSQLLETTITSTFARSFSTSQKAAALYLIIDGEVLLQKLNYRNNLIKENTMSQL
jgi:hypothetical protein